MVRTDEFALVRFGGDQAEADAVYAGVAEPLTADDIADAIAWVATRPPHVNVDELVIRPRAQAAQHKVHRVTSSRARLLIQRRRERCFRPIWQGGGAKSCLSAQRATPTQPDRVGNDAQQARDRGDAP